MSTNQLPNSPVNGLGESDPNPTQSTAGFFTTASDPSLLDTREPITNRAFSAQSLPEGIISTSIDDSYDRGRLGSPPNPSTRYSRAMRAGTPGDEESGTFDQNVQVSIPDEDSEPLGSTSAPDIHSGSQENDYFYGEDIFARDGDGRGSPQLMWYQGEEYYEELFEYNMPREFPIASIINLMHLCS